MTIWKQKPYRERKKYASTAEATARYIKKTLTKIQVSVRKEEAEEFKARAKEYNISMAHVFKAAMAEFLASHPAGGHGVKAEPPSNVQEKP